MLPLVILGKKLGVKLIHDLARIYNSSAIARFKGDCNATDVREDLLKYRPRYVNDLLDFVIRIAIKIFRVMLLTFAVDKVIDVDVEEYILVVPL